MNELTQILLNSYIPQQKLSMLDWGLRNIIIPTNYQSPIRGTWTLERFPIFKGILEEIDNPQYKEFVVLKCSQLGFSQNVLLPIALKNFLEGFPVIYATGTQAQAEQFLIERLKPLLFACPILERNNLRERESELYLTNGGLLTTIHQSSKTATKARPAKIICADELDIWQNNTLEKLKSRTTHYNNSKIIVGSCPDADAKQTKINNKFLSPIFCEWEDSSQARYFLNLNGEEFPLDFGFRKGKEELPAYGIKWGKDARRKDGTWDEQRIAETVYYQTPNGQRISDKEKDKLLDGGKWIHLFNDRKKRGFHANGIYIKGKEFAELAIGYLKAKRQGGMIFRTWLLENFAENLETEKIEFYDRTLKNLCGDYSRKQPFDFPVKRIMGVDVQTSANGIWFLIAEYADDKIYVKDWGQVFSFDDINRIANETHCNNVSVDCGFDVRRPEVYDASQRFRFVPVMGRSRTAFGKIWEAQNVDSQMGKAGQGKNRLTQILFQSETLKTILFEIMAGQNHTKIQLPKDYDEILETQLTSEVYEDGKFIAKTKDNHLLDCLTYSFMLAKFFKYIPA